MSEKGMKEMTDERRVDMIQAIVHIHVGQRHHEQRRTAISIHLTRSEFMLAFAIWLSMCVVHQHVQVQ